MITTKIQKKPLTKLFGDVRYFRDDMPNDKCGCCHKPIKGENDTVYLKEPGYLAKLHPECLSDVFFKETIGCLLMKN